MTKAVMFFLLNKREAGFLVDVPRFYEHTLGPEHEFLIATAASEANTLFNKASAETQPTRPGLNQEKSEPGNRFTTLRDKHGANDLQFVFQ